MQVIWKERFGFIEKIHQVVEDNMENSDFNIDTIAASIGLSRSAFFKKLKSLTGLAPVDWVKEIRLNKSVELIKKTDLSISEIALLWDSMIPVILANVSVKVQPDSA